MGLSDYIRRKAYSRYWRLRHWYMDTERGREARVVILAVACLVLVVQVARMTVAALDETVETERQR